MNTMPFRLPPWMLVLLALTVLIPTGCAQDTRTEAQRVADARTSIEKLRYREAIIEMRNLLLNNSRNSEARLLLGEALLALGDFATAQKEAERARDLGAPPERYAEMLARALQGTGNHVEVLSEIRTIDIENEELVSTLKALRARSMLEIGSIDRAVASFNEELDAAKSVEARRIALMGLASIAANEEDFEQAESLNLQAIELAPGVPETVLALGRVYLKQEKYQHARDLLARARTEEIRARREDWFFLEAQYIEALLGLNDLEGAREATRSLVAIGHDHPMALYLQGRVAFDAGNNDRAIDYFQQVLASYPNYSPAHALMGIAMIQLEDFDQAEMHLANAVINNPDNARARRLLAETRLRMGRDKAAVRTLSDGLSLDDTNTDLLTMLGRARLRGGDQSAGLDNLEEAYRRTPDSVQAGLALASAYLSSGDSLRAISVLRSLPEKALSDERRSILIRVAQLDNNNQARAERQIESLLVDAPNDRYVIGLAGSFYAAINKLDEARKLFRKLLADSPGNRSAMLNILNLDERIDDYTESRALFEAAHAEDASDLLPTLVLARIYEATGDSARSLEMIKIANSNDPSALLPNLMLASQALRDRDYKAAEEFTAIAVKEYPASARAHALHGFALMYRNQTSEARMSFQRAVVLSPETIQYRYFLGRSALASGQFFLARSSFATVIRNDDNHLPARRSMGVLQANAGKTIQADKLVDDIEENFGKNRPALVAVGEIRAAQGKALEAIEAFEAAQALGPSWAVAQALFTVRKAHELDDPTQTLVGWQQRFPEDSRPQLKIAQYHHEQGDHVRAIREYEHLLNIDPNSIIAHNNLAWLTFQRNQSGDQTRAIELARTAFELSDESPGVADTYGWLLFQTGQIDDSRHVLRDAFDQVTATGSPEIAFHYASVLAHDGAWTTAQSVLENALRTEGRFPSRRAAQSLLDTITVDRE
ncbi:MAG: XrtA/PEP-CTERM system TPR-repeat protein PrsT [Pseudomonadota bacterium]